MPGFLEELTKSIGVGRVTSGYRDPEEQDRLHRAGKTRVPGGHSAHNKGDPDKPFAVDIGGVQRGQEADVRARVERATGRKIGKIIWETGSGRNQGTGPHFHIEFADGASAAVSPQGKLRVTESWTDPATVQATPEEKAAMAQPRTTVQDVFAPETTQDVKQSYEQSDSRLGMADALLTQLQAKTTEVNAGREELLTRTVAVKKGINDQQRADLQHLTELATPVWEEREALATRMLELDNMNPLEAGIRGMFDPNYNRNNLRGRVRVQDEALGYLESIFADKQKYGQVLSQLAQADYNDSEAVAQLMLQNGGEDVRLALQSFNIATQDMDLIMRGVNADTALTSAKNQARADILSGMSVGQVNEALSQAEQNGGVAIVNGVELRVGELQETQMRMQSQDISLRLQQLALERGEVDLIEANQENILKTMTIADVQRAIADGYSFKGVQLDPVKVGARLQDLQKTQASIVGQDSLKTAGGVVSETLKQYAGVTRATAGRFAGLFGVVPEEFNRRAVADQSVINAFNKGLDQAKISGTVEEYLATQIPVVQQLLDGQRKVVEESVKRWSGGNKDMQAVGVAWMTGQPLDSEAAMKGLVHMARNGVPAGTKFTGTAANVLKTVKGVVDKWDKGNTGQGGGSLDEILAGGSGQGVKEKQAAMMQELRSAISRSYNSTLGDQFFRSIPEKAAQIKVNGRPHPFSQINQQEWSQAVQMGDRAGLAASAHALDMSPEDFQTMLRQGPKGAIWQEVSKGKAGLTWQQVASGLQANQLQETMTYLDLNESATGFVPSQALRDLVNQPEFKRQMQGGDTQESNTSFGGFITSMAAGGGYANEVDNLINNIDAAYVTKQAAVMETRKRRAASLAGDPIARAKFVLGAVSGLSPEEETLLLGEIKTRFGSQTVTQTIKGALTFDGGRQSVGVDDLRQQERINSWIMSGESPDPAVNNALKKARRQWEKLSPSIQQALDKFSGN